MVKRLFSLATILLVALVVLAACGGDDEDDDQTRVPVPNAPSPPATTPTAAAAASPQASPGASPVASPQASPGVPPAGSPPAPPPSPAGERPPPPPTALTVELLDIRFEPTTLTIPANIDVTVTVTNNGAIPHTFTIEALGVDTGSMAAGETKEVTINAQPGEYEYECTEPGHKAAGMVGTLTVQ